jgi:hypothetical protein
MIQSWLRLARERIDDRRIDSHATAESMRKPYVSAQLAMQVECSPLLRRSPSDERRSIYQATVSYRMSRDQVTFRCLSKIKNLLHDYFDYFDYFGFERSSSSIHVVTPPYPKFFRTKIVPLL